MRLHNLHFLLDESLRWLDQLECLQSEKNSRFSNRYVLRERLNEIYRYNWDCAQAYFAGFFTSLLSSRGLDAHTDDILQGICKSDYKLGFLLDDIELDPGDSRLQFSIEETRDIITKWHNNLLRQHSYMIEYIDRWQAYNAMPWTKHAELTGK